MRRLCLCFTMGVLVAAAATAAFGVGYLKIHPVNPHYFQDSSTGKPVLLAGYQSVVPTDAGYDYMNGYNGINTLKARRVRYSRVWHFLPWALSNAIWPWGRSNTPGAPMGGNKIDMNTWNPTYWTRLKDSLAQANAGGIYCSIHLFDKSGMVCCWLGNPWASDNNVNGLETPPASASDGLREIYQPSLYPNIAYQEERYIRKMIDETIAYPNVIYEIENEHAVRTSVGWADHYSQFVKDYIAANYPDSPRLVSHSSIKGVDADLDNNCFAMPGLDIINSHNSYDSDPSQFNVYLETRWARNKAISIDEFANGVSDTNILRQECWTIISSGGNFHIEDAYAQSLPYDVAAGVNAFLRLSGWDFIHAAPNKALITSGGGYCMAQPGVEYFCYFPTGGSKTITLSAGTYRVEWWNPRTGGFYNISTISHAGGSRALSAPDSNDWALHVTTQPALTTVLQSRFAGSITVDGSGSDWALDELSTKICGGDTGAGDIGIVGYDTDGVCYSGGHASNQQYPPTPPGMMPPGTGSDHAVRFYSRHDASYLYFLVRCDDSDLQYSNPTSSNNLNDCVDIFFDPSHSHGSTAISNSTSNAELVIDANNQKNVYGCTAGYANQVLAGVTSSVVRDSTGWWLEARIAKDALSPAMPATGTIGLDLSFRDNDSNGSTTLSTVYTWRDPEVSASFPTKIPDRWGDLTLLPEPIVCSNPAEAKMLTDNTELMLTAGTVSAVFGDSFYVQCIGPQCGACGIRVVKAGHTLQPGQSATVRGTILTDAATGERYIAATWLDGSGTGTVAPVGMTNLSLGGSDQSYDPGAGQEGVLGGAGPNNIGLLVRAWGQVTQREIPGLGYFYIDDGSFLRDTTITGGLDNVGIRVQADPTAYPTGSHVVVTGISTCFKDATGNIRRRVIPLATGIQTISP